MSDSLTECVLSADILNYVSMFGCVLKLAATCTLLNKICCNRENVYRLTDYLPTRVILTPIWCVLRPTAILNGIPGVKLVDSRTDTSKRLAVCKIMRMKHRFRGDDYLFAAIIRRRELTDVELANWRRDNFKLPTSMMRANLVWRGVIVEYEGTADDSCSIVRHYTTKIIGRIGRREQRFLKHMQIPYE